MPYTNTEQVPSYVPASKARAWMDAWNSAFAKAIMAGETKEDAEKQAFVAANKVARERSTTMGNRNELRTIHGASLRAEQYATTGKRVVRGWAATFNTHSVIGGGGRGAFREVIKPGAFKAAVARGDDCRLTLNHSSDAVLARVKAGNLTLAEDPKGLFFSATLLDTQAGRDMYKNVQAGLYDQCSFAFRVEDGGEDWLDDSDCDCCGADSKLPLRVLRAVELFDVSIVDRPAYGGTSAEAAFTSTEVSSGEHDDVDDDETDDNAEMIAYAGARVSVEARKRAAQISSRRGIARGTAGRSDADRLAILADFNRKLDTENQLRLRAATKLILLSETVADLDLRSQQARDLAFAEDVKNLKRAADILRNPSAHFKTCDEYLTWLKDFKNSH